MKAILIELQPYSPLLGARTTVRVADSPSSNSFGLGGVPWDPAIKQRPRLAMSLCSPQLDGKVQTGSCTFSLNLAEIRNAVNPQLLHWRGGFVTIYTVEDDSYSLRKTEFVGRVTQAGFNGDKTLINISAQVSTQFIEKPLLTLEYSGGGGIDGEPAMKGVLRPAGFGSVENIPPVWFDATYNIGQIDGYGNCTAITKLMEGGSDMGPRVADYASYTALKDAIITGVIPKGRWGTCVAQGLIGLGAPPAGVMGANATFGSNRTGQMMRRILETHAGVATADIDINAFTALDTAVNRAVHYWTKDQRMVRDLLEALAAAANATPIVTMQGTVTVSRGVASTPVATLDRQGQQSPHVINWASAEILAPFWMVKARAARPANVLSLDEVMYEDDIVDRGLWSNTTVYYRGNVAWSSAGARYLYINATASSGAGLGNTAYWQLLTAAPAAEYSDGTSINALRPQEAGSNVTENRTAAAIDGQGSLATKSSVAWTTDLTGRPANISALTGAENIKNTDITISSSGVLSGAGTANVQVANVQAAFAARKAWDFGDGTTQGITGLNSTLSVDAYGVLKITPTTSDPYIRIPIPSWPGKTISVIRARVRLVSPTPGSWAGEAFYNTSGHGESNSYVKRLNNPQVTSGQWFILEWDMAALTVGGTDFLDNVVSSLRLDIEQTTNVWEIDWIAVGQYAVDPVAVRGIVDNADVTSANTAAAIAGQGAFATYGKPIASLAAPNPNLFPWPSPPDPGIDSRSPTQLGWVNMGNGSGFVYGAYNAKDARGIYYYANRNGNYGAVTIWPFYEITPALGVGASMAVSMNSGGAPNGAVFIPYVEFLNSAKNTVLGTFYLALNTVSGRWEGTGTVPSGAVHMRIVCRCDFPAFNGYQEMDWWGIKVENGATVTPLAPLLNEVVTNAQWNTGQNLNQLKPQELGANVTENRSASGIAGQGWGATASETAAGNRYVPVGKNQVVNSKFTRGTYAWYAPGISFGINLNASYSGKRNVAWAQKPGALLASGSYHDISMHGWWSAGDLNLMKRNYMPVSPGDRVYFSALVAPHRCQAQVYCLVLSATGSLLQGPNYISTRNGGGNDGDPNNFDLKGGIFDVVHADAAYALLMIRMLGNGGTDPYLFFTEPMLCKVAAGQTAFPPYNDGPIDMIADPTADNTAAGISGQGALATQNQVSTGTIAPNSVVVPYVLQGADVTANTTVTAIEMPSFLTIGDGSGGSAIITFSASFRSLVDDRQIMINMLVDTGGGYVGVAATYIGVRSDSGVGTDFKLTGQLNHALSAAQVRVAVNVQVQGYNTGGDAGTAGGSAVVKTPTIVITGGKR